MMKSCAKAKIVRKEVIKRHLIISWSNFLKVSHNFLQSSLFETNDTNKMFILVCVSIYFNNSLHHCVKIVQIRSFSWSVFSWNQSEYKKIRTRKNSVFGHFSWSYYDYTLWQNIFEITRSPRGRKNVYFQDLFSKCKQMHLSVDMLPLTELKTIFV